MLHSSFYTTLLKWKDYGDRLLLPGIGVGRGKETGRTTEVQGEGSLCWQNCISILYFTIVLQDVTMERSWEKDTKKSLCILSYNCMWIYNYPTIKSLEKYIYVHLENTNEEEKSSSYPPGIMTVSILLSVLPDFSVHRNTCHENWHCAAHTSHPARGSLLTTFVVSLSVFICSKHNCDEHPYALIISFG
jgi:hypothetical protein